MQDLAFLAYSPSATSCIVLFIVSPETDYYLQRMYS